VIQTARFFTGFFRWYNQEHRHSGLGLLTPAMVHYNKPALILEQRQAVLRCRLSRSTRTLRAPGAENTLGSTEVWINKPLNADENMLTKFHDQWSQTR